MHPVIYEAMRIDRFTFGSIRIDGVLYEHDVVIDAGQVRKRSKKASRPFRDAFGHTPLSVKEDIPWNGRRLVVGTGAEGALSVKDEFEAEAGRRDVELVTSPTREAIRGLQSEPENTNAICTSPANRSCIRVDLRLRGAPSTHPTGRTVKTPR